MKLALCLVVLGVLCLLAVMLFVVVAVNSVVLVIDVIYCGWQCYYLVHSYCIVMLVCVWYLGWMLGIGV